MSFNAVTCTREGSSKSGKSHEEKLLENVINCLEYRAHSRRVLEESRKSRIAVRETVLDSRQITDVSRDIGEKLRRAGNFVNRE